MPSLKEKWLAKLDVKIEENNKETEEDDFLDDLEDELEITSLYRSLRYAIFDEMVVENQLATKSIVPPPPCALIFIFRE